MPILLRDLGKVVGPLGNVSLLLCKMRQSGGGSGGLLIPLRSPSPVPIHTPNPGSWSSVCTRPLT